MNEDLTDFMCSVFLDGDELRKIIQMSDIY